MGRGEGTRGVRGRTVIWWGTPAEGGLGEVEGGVAIRGVVVRARPGGRRVGVTPAEGGGEWKAKENGRGGIAVGG